MLEEFLNPIGLSQGALAAHISLPVQRVKQIVHGKREITPESAWLFSEALGTTHEIRMNLQANYDLVLYKPKRLLPRIASAASIESKISPHGTCGFWPTKW